MDDSSASAQDVLADITSVQSTELLESLQRRADKLLTEFRSYQSYLKSNNLSKDVETRIFRRGVEAEHKNLGSLGPKDTVKEPDLADEVLTKGDESKRLQALRSSNLPFYEAVWASAKRSRGIRALGRRLYWDEGQKHANARHLPEHEASSKHPRKKQGSVLVDIVADDGAQWIKVSIVTAKRLIFEMAKEGWEGYGASSDEGSEDHEESSNAHSSGPAKLEIVKLAEDLRDASRETRVKFRHPQVIFILPRAEEGVDKLVDAVIADLRHTGARVICGDLLESEISRDEDRHGIPQSLAIAFDVMLPSPQHPRLTPTLNIDCTILLALISDISHVSRQHLPPSPSNSSGTYHSAILKQVESEEQSPLLPNELYPTMEGRKLVCTHLAAKRMREIVETMGTASERSRAESLFREGKYQGLSAQDLQEAWKGLSCHDLPSNISLPIIVQEFTFSPDQDMTHPTVRHDAAMDEENVSPPHAITQGHMRPISTCVDRLTQAYNLSPINASVFIYGWINDIVTVTSNKVVAVGIERSLNQILDEEERYTTALGADNENREKNAKNPDFVGPKMYICETARSLIGKEKVNGLRP